MDKQPYLIVTGDFVKTGGMDRANYALADYLSQQGHSVHLVAHRVEPALLERPQVKFHRVPKLANSYIMSASLLDQAGRLHARKLRQMGGRVVANGGSCQWGDINWVHYVHAMYKPQSQSGWLQHLKWEVAHWQFLRTEQQALALAKFVIVNSDQTKKHLMEKLAIPEARIHRIYYGTDPQIFYPATPQERTELRRQLGWAEDQRTAVFIGALGDRRKGLDILFAVWQQLCADPTWDVDLAVVGGGAELPLWQAIASQAGLANRIHFLGFRSDVPDLLRAADCLISPTRYEAYGLGVHEALCCGLPAFVSASAGIAERYPSHLNNLLLPDPENISDLVHRLQQWRILVQEYNQQLSTFANELRSYSWNDMAQNILDRVAESDELD